ncbi:MAG: HigA family addiction module antitoxin [Pseudomonadota bacterium]
MLAPITPGEILLEEFLRPLGISQNRLARDIDVPVSRIADIIHGKRAISADTALRLARAFGVSEKFWLNLQNEFDLRRLRNSTGPSIEAKIRKYATAEL